MEDASKEFQVFMSPKRDYRQSLQEMPKSTKQRVVPVISKLLSSSPSLFQNLSINQKKGSNVYRAVSGVSFQNTSKDSNHLTKSDRTRRQSFTPASPLPKERADFASGARRSRSLTNMESELSAYFDTKKKEITHPCTPIILTSGNTKQGLYASGRSRRRSTSQIRNSIRSESKRGENSPKVDQPERPRRTRSASRTRKSSALSAFPADAFLTTASTASSEDTVQSERKFRKKSESAIKKSSSKERQQKLSTNEIKMKDIDFNVNENDWQKYDVLVSKQLSNILKAKEEPEGGYFSLEREETEEAEHKSDVDEYFQRDSCNESIYVAQSLASNDTIPSQDTITIEEIYREVLFDSPSQEVGFVDDEGLYEEIFFERPEKEKSPINVSNTVFGEVESNRKPKQDTPSPLRNNLIVTSPINILISPENHQDLVIPLTPLRNKKSSRGSMSTVVHIGGSDSTSEVVTMREVGLQEPPKIVAAKETNFNTAYNMWSYRDSNQLPNKKTETTVQQNELSNSEIPEDLCDIYDNHLFIRESIDNEVSERKRDFKQKTAFFQKLSKNSSSLPECQSNLKHGKSTSSVDRIFSSKHFSPVKQPDIELNKSRKTRSDSHLLRNTKDNVFVDNSCPGVEYRSNTVCISCPLKPNQSSAVASPPSFQGFLRNSIFNPETESLIDDTEELVLNDGQVVTCITDSSSDESEDDSTNSNQWLEADSEFEFQAFNETPSTKPKIINMQRKSRKNIPKIPLSTIHAEPEILGISVARSGHFQSEFQRQVPERPSRRRRREFESKTKLKS